MTLHLHHAGDLDVLLDALAEILAAPVDDPFRPDLVVVPAIGMQDAVMAGLGRRLGVTDPALGDGIVANVEFAFPGRFLARALGESVHRDDVEVDPWRLPRLTWAVLDELAADTVEVPRAAGRTDSWALARRIADLFDRYATQRPQLVQAWADGPDETGRDGDGTFTVAGQPAELAPGHRWQADLWRAVRRRLGVDSPPERLPYLLDALRSEEIVPDLPGRVAVIGFGTIAPTMLRVSRALGDRRDLHVFLRRPSPVAWNGTGVRLAGRLTTRSVADVAAAVSHPLLASWARPALEARTMLADLPDVVEHDLDADRDVPVVEARRSLLGAIQDDVRADREPQRRAPDVVDPADGTIQIHACHGEVRQLEVVRDALGHAFVDDPTLHARDVMVLCPDLNRFAPLIEAVLGRGALPVPVHLGDRSLSTVDPLVGALRAILDVVAGRATATEVIALTQFEPVRLRFGWSIDDVERLTGWCATLGTRWGLTPEQRLEWGLPGDLRTGTWRAAVDRLLAGIAVPAPTLRPVLGDVVPHDDIGTDDLDVVGGLADLLARLVALHTEVIRPRPVASWVDLLHDILDGCCAVADDESWRMIALHQHLDDVVAAASLPDGVPCGVDLSVSDVRALLADTLTDRPGRIRLRTGAVTVSSLVPQHGVPARVVCLVGFDDASLRGGTFDGDDVLGANPCVGERHPRHDQRQLLLDAVLAARDRLIVTCNGADLATNAEVPFAVPLVELLDVVAATTTLDGQLAPVVSRHPRHGFDERALQADGRRPDGVGPFTFDRSMLVAALAKRSAADGGDPVWTLPPSSPATLSVDELVGAITKPARTYLRDRLDVRLPREPDVIEDALPLDVDPLELSALGRRCLDAVRRTGDLDDWESAALVDDALPPGALRRATLALVRADIDAIVATVDGLIGTPFGRSGDLVVDRTITVDDGEGRPAAVRITGALSGMVDTPGGPRLTRIEYVRPKHLHRFEAAVRLALATLERPGESWESIVVTRGKDGRGGTTLVHLALRDDDGGRSEAARRLVEASVLLHRWARRDAVPWFDATSGALASGAVGKAAGEWDKDVKYGETNFVWGRMTFDEMFRLPLIDTDPSPVRTTAEWLERTGGRPVGRATAVATWLWRCFDASVVDLGDAGSRS